jgi:hypothetical protein
MDGVEQVHFFLACDPSVEGSIAGANWNKITIEYLRSAIIQSGKRPNVKGKAPGRFNFLVELTEAFAKVIPKVFRSKRQDGWDGAKRAGAVPELMRRDAGQLLLWANMEGEEPGKCLDFVPEGLCTGNFGLDATDVQNSVHTNRYSRTQPVLGHGMVVDQLLFVLAVPGYDKVDTTPLPKNEDIDIDTDNKLQVRLSRRPLYPGDEWNEQGHLQDLDAVDNQIQTYDLGLMNWTNTEITQSEGLIKITIHGMPRRPDSKPMR